MDECGFKERLEIIRREWKDHRPTCPLLGDEGPCYACEALEIAEILITWPPRIENEHQCKACGGPVCPGCGRGDC